MDVEEKGSGKEGKACWNATNEPIRNADAWIDEMPGAGGKLIVVFEVESEFSDFEIQLSPLQGEDQSVLLLDVVYCGDQVGQKTWHDARYERSKSPKYKQVHLIGEGEEPLQKIDVKTVS